MHDLNADRRAAESRHRINQASRLLGALAEWHGLDPSPARDYVPPPPVRDFLSYGRVLVRAIEILNARPCGRWTVTWKLDSIIVTPPAGIEIVYPSGDLSGYFGDPNNEEDLNARAEAMALGLARSTRWLLDADRSRDTLHFEFMHSCLESVRSGDIIHMDPDDPFAVESVRFVVYYVDPWLLFLVREDGEMLSPDLPLDTDKWRLTWKELPSIGFGCINDDCEEDRTVRCPVCKAFMDADQLLSHTHWKHVRQGKP